MQNDTTRYPLGQRFVVHEQINWIASARHIKTRVERETLG
jgi:hypothetical protein